MFSKAEILLKKEVRKLRWKAEKKRIEATKLDIEADEIERSIEKS